MTKAILNTPKPVETPPATVDLLGLSIEEAAILLRLTGRINDEERPGFKNPVRLSQVYAALNSIPTVAIRAKHIELVAEVHGIQPRQGTIGTITAYVG